MPGQKKDTPSELCGGRIFYETLKVQIPESQIAAEYLLKYGLLPREEATRMVEELEKIKQKNTAKTKKATPSKQKRAKPKKRRARARKSKSSKSKKKIKTKKKSKAKIRLPLNFDLLLGESSEESS